MLKPLELPHPHSIRRPDVCRRVAEADLAGHLNTDLTPRPGDVALAEVIDLGRHRSIDLDSGRTGSLQTGDRLWVALGEHYAPLEVSGTCPSSLGEAALFSAAGVAGVCDPGYWGAAPTRLRLLGLARAADGRVTNLAHYAISPAGQRPELSLCVVSSARGSRASAVAQAVVRGLVQMGSRVGVAKLSGIIDANERWSYCDAGASVAYDQADIGWVSGAGQPGSALVAGSQRLLAALGAQGASAAVLRVAGGFASSEVRSLTQAAAGQNLWDAIIVAAADAWSAIETARQLREQGHRVIAVGGALTRSPLACREARAGVGCALIDNPTLANPTSLHGLIAASIDRSPDFALAA